VVWNGAWIAAGATLDRCVVTSGVRVPADFRTSNAVLLPASLARASDPFAVRDGIAIAPIT
jgi:hypothetical protein